MLKFYCLVKVDVHVPARLGTLGIEDAPFIVPLSVMVLPSVDKVPVPFKVTVKPENGAERGL